MKIIKGLRPSPAKGQSMVEMAIIAPLLIFFLIGIFEVGWALRNYLVLVNTNREITRFAIRPGYMNFSTQANVASSFMRVRDWMTNTTSSQLEFNFDETDGTTTLIISHMVIDTGWPCDPGDPPDEPPAPCKCGWFNPNDPLYTDPDKEVFTKDDIIIHPGKGIYDYQSITYGPITTTHNEVRRTRQDYELIAEKLTEQNNRFNCELIEKEGIPSANNVIITELFHDQPQLFGFPLISNPFTDPVHLYTHTVMRLTGGARSSGGAGGSLIANIDLIGEVCFAHPIIVSEALIGGNYPPTIPENSPIDILDESIAGDDKGWVIWDPTESDTVLEYEMRYPQMSVNSYVNPYASTDEELDQGDYVRSLQGTHLSVITNTVNAWIGRETIVPVYDPGVSPDAGHNYKVTGFIKVRIQEVTLTPPKINAVFLGDAPEACKNTPPPPP